MTTTPKTDPATTGILESYEVRGTDVHDETGRYVGAAVICLGCDQTVLDEAHGRWLRADGAHSCVAWRTQHPTAMLAQGPS